MWPVQLPRLFSALHKLLFPLGLCAVILIIMLMIIINALGRTLKGSGQLYYAPCYRLLHPCHIVSSKYMGIHTTILVMWRG